MLYAYWAILVAAIFFIFAGIGFILKKLRGDDGPMGDMDRDVARNHLWSRWF